MIFRMTLFLIHFNFFTTPKSQKSNVWCLKVLSFSQHLQCPIPIIIYVKCPISILQNSWQLEILSELPLFELDSKVALTRYFFFIEGSSKIVPVGACITWNFWLYCTARRDKNCWLSPSCPSSLLQGTRHCSSCCFGEHKIQRSHHHLYRRGQATSESHRVYDAMLRTVCQ